MEGRRNLLNFDAQYPGIELAVEISVLQEYLDHMESAIKAAQSNYIETQEKEFHGCEYDEYRHIYLIAETELPRVIRSPHLLAIYSLFESGVSRLLNYCQKKEGKKLSINDINGKTQIIQYNKYLESILEFNFQFGEQVKHDINKIGKVRNCIAHANGRLSAMGDGKADQIRTLVENEASLNLDGDQLDIRPEFLTWSIISVENAVRSLMNNIEARYYFYGSAS